MRAQQSRATTTPTRRNGSAVTLGLRCRQGISTIEGALMMPRGGIVGRCNVIAHVDPQRRVWLDPGATEQDPEITELVDFRWHMAGSYGSF